MDPLPDVRCRILKEAALSICGYCQGTKGLEPIPNLVQGQWLHLFTKGNGANPCSASPIWDLIEQATAEPDQASGNDFSICLATSRKISGTEANKLNGN